MAYDAMNMLFQFGLLLATSLTAVVAIIAIVINIKSNLPSLRPK